MAYQDTPNAVQVFEDGLMLQLRVARRSTRYNKSKAYAGTTFATNLENAEQGLLEALEILEIDFGGLI